MALLVSELFHQVVLLVSGGSTPGLWCQCLRVFPYVDGDGGSVAGNVAHEACVQLREFVFDLFDDLVRGSRGVFLVKGPVLVTVDHDRCLGWSFDSVVCPAESSCTAQPPPIANVERNAGIHGRNALDDIVVPFIHAGRIDDGFIADLNADHACKLRVANGLIGDELDTSRGQVQIEWIAPEFGFATTGARMSFVVGSTRDAVQVDEYADTPSITTGDDGLDGGPSIDIDLGGLLGESRVGTESRSQREITNRQTDVVAVSSLDQPCEIVVGESIGPMSFPLPSCLI